jgi:hypothetical protein
MDTQTSLLHGYPVLATWYIHEYIGLQIIDDLSTNADYR